MEALQNRSIRYEYRHTNSSLITRSTSLLTLHKGSSNSPEHPDNHTDRNAAIALSVLIFLILMAIAWYFRLHSCAKRRFDLERQQCHEQRASIGSWSRSRGGGNVWYRRSSSNATEVTRYGSRKNSTFKLKPVMTRKDSVATSEGNPEIYKKRKWPSLSHWRTQDSGASTLAPHEHNHEPLERSASSEQPATLAPSILDDITVPLTSTERPSPTHSHHSSQRHYSISFLPVNLSNPTPPPRRSSLPLSFDKTWWDEVARRGSTSSCTRRLSLSVLEPVLEPDVRGYEYESRVTKNGSKDNIGKEIISGTRRISKDEGGNRDSCDTSWRGSKCEGSVLYDWTRPSDVEIQRASEIRYTKVDWGRERERGRRASIQRPVVGRRVEWDECIQEMDFALMR